MRIVTFISLLLNLTIIICPLLYVHARISRVIGGTDSPPEDIKYLVSVQIQGFHMCGGAIIDDRFILTAAHCVVSTANNRFWLGSWRIAAGTNDRNDSNAIFADVEKLFVPKSFHIPKSLDDAWNADIAVLRLKQSLELTSSERLQKLHLATEPTSLINVKVKFAGFGTDYYERLESPLGGSYDVSSVSGRAHQINATILEPTECQKFSPRKLSNTDLCARISEPNTNRPAGICMGDSGSPMVYNEDTVIAVAARADKPCNQNFIPAYYTRVSPYLPFILNAMNDDTDDMWTVEV